MLSLHPFHDAGKKEILPWKNLPTTEKAGSNPPLQLFVYLLSPPNEIPRTKNLEVRAKIIRSGIDPIVAPMSCTSQGGGFDPP